MSDPGIFGLPLCGRMGNGWNGQEKIIALGMRFELFLASDIVFTVIVLDIYVLKCLMLIAISVVSPICFDT